MPYYKVTYTCTHAPSEDVIIAIKKHANTIPELLKWLETYMTPDLKKWFRTVDVDSIEEQ